MLWKHSFFSNLPNKLDIGIAHVDVVHGARSQGVLSCSSSISKQNLSSYIVDNKGNNTGFLLWISGYCISCVFQNRVNLRYNLFAYDVNKPAHTLHVFSSVDSLVDMFCATIVSKFNCFELNYQILFLSCSCELSDKERKQVVRKYKSSSAKASIRKRRRDNYHSIDPEQKEQLLSKCAEKYTNMDSQEKDRLLSKNTEKYKTMNQQRKEKLLSDYAEKYENMIPQEKEQLLSKMTEKHKNMTQQEKKQLLSKTTEKYKNMNPQEKERLLSNKTEMYKTMDPQRKKRLLSKYAEKYANMDPQRKERFLNNIKQKYHEMGPVAKRQKLVKQRETRKVNADKMI